MKSEKINKLRNNTLLGKSIENPMKMFDGKIVTNRKKLLEMVI